MPLASPSPDANGEAAISFVSMQSAPPDANTPAPFPIRAVVAVAIIVALFLGGPSVAVHGLPVAPATKFSLEAQWRGAFALSLLAGVFAWCAVQLSHNLRLMSHVLEQSSATQAASERASFFAAQAGETARYAGAMALLGHESLEVRLGGIYALERLARESKADHGPVMEVLAAFARSRAPWREEDIAPARPGADVQAILTVIGRRTRAFDAPDSRLDLHGVALARVYAPFANLENAQLYEANLEGAVLQSADLRGAWLWKAHMAGAVLDGAHLEGADLTGASGLTVAQLQTAHMDKATKLPENVRPEFDPVAANTPPRAAPATPSASAPSEADMALPSMRSAV